MEGGAGQKARDSSAVADRGKKRLQMSFGGCGFLGVYHIGVGKCVMDHAPHLFDEFERFYGASAGAITAVWAACKLDAMVAYKWVKKTFEASRKYRILGTLHPSMDLYSRVRVFLEETLPVNAHKLTRGKVQISLTKFPSMKNWLVSNFATRKELINVSASLAAISLSMRIAVTCHSCARACSQPLLSPPPLLLLRLSSPAALSLSMRD